MALTQRVHIFCFGRRIVSTRVLGGRAQPRPAQAARDNEPAPQLTAWTRWKGVCGGADLDQRGTDPEQVRQVHLREHVVPEPGPPSGRCRILHSSPAQLGRGRPRPQQGSGHGTKCRRRRPARSPRARPEQLERRGATAAGVAAGVADVVHAEGVVVQRPCGGARGSTHHPLMTGPCGPSTRPPRCASLHGKSRCHRHTHR